jgi:aspartate aminotransferase
VTLEDDVAVANYLLDEARCAVVPGTAFGAPGHLRISYATSEAQIDEGLRRIGAAVKKLV